MKLKRTQLKQILKECILELLGEGAFDKVISESLHGTTPNRIAANDFAMQPAQQGNYPQQPSLQTPMLQQQQQQQQQQQPNPYGSVGMMSPAQRLQELARATAVRQSGGNSNTANMLHGIFADTAMTTFQQELAAGQVRDGQGLVLAEVADPQGAAIDQAELEALSGGRGASHWARIAFGGQNK